MLWARGNALQRGRAPQSTTCCVVSPVWPFGVFGRGRAVKDGVGDLGPEAGTALSGMPRGLRYRQCRASLVPNPEGIVMGAWHTLPAAVYMLNLACLPRNTFLPCTHRRPRRGGRGGAGGRGASARNAGGVGALW